MRNIFRLISALVIAVLLFSVTSFAGPIQFNGPSNLHPTSISMLANGDLVGGAWIDQGSGQKDLATYYFNAATQSFSYSVVSVPSGYQIGTYDGSVAQRHGTMVSWNLIQPSGSDTQFAIDALNPSSSQFGPLDSYNSFGVTTMTQSGVSAGFVGGVVPAYGNLGGTPVYLNTGLFVAGGVADATDVTGGTLFVGGLEDGILPDMSPVIWDVSGNFQILPTNSLIATSPFFTGAWIDDTGRYVYYLSGDVLYGYDTVTGNFDYAKDSFGNPIFGLRGAGVTQSGTLLGNGYNGTTFAWNLNSNIASLQNWWSGVYGAQSASFIQSSWILAGVSDLGTTLAVALDGSLHVISADSTEVPEPLTLLSLAFGLGGVPMMLKRRDRAR